jgi:hypothetical protein
MTDPVWCVMPVLAGLEMTEAALSDLLAQSVPTKILVINQGVDDAFRDRLERLSEQEARILVWHHQPPLLSLSASWNLALDLVWRTGGKVAFVVNNDVRLSPGTIWGLATVLDRTDALFVSAVGVTADQFDPQALTTVTTYLDTRAKDIETTADMKGGPDFSCFLISRACHERFRFDEHFVPAFCEDLDYHRRLMLAGEGSRIFSITIPYLHLASQTLKGGYLPEAEVTKIRETIEKQSRAYYAKKWGGPVNHETYYRPFNDGDDRSDVRLDRIRAGVGPTTPELQAWVQSGKSTVLRDAEPEFETPAEIAEYHRRLKEQHGQDTRPAEPERRIDTAGEGD